MTETRAVSLHRYPVKSLLGEPLTTLDVDERGVVGDRVWSVRTASGKFGSGKSTTRFEAVIGLLQVRATTHDSGVMITFPDDGSHPIDDPATARLLSDRLNQPLTFGREADVSHYDDGPVSLVGLASVRALSEARGVPIDPARFRANIRLDTERPFIEDEWIGHRVAIGTVVLEVMLPSPRCVMINMASADLPEQPGNLAALGRLHDQCLGVIARVVTPGQIGTGDELRLL